jgi:hypothetical protein
MTAVGLEERRERVVKERLGMGLTWRCSEQVNNGVGSANHERI